LKASKKPLKGLEDPLKALKASKKPLEGLKETPQRPQRGRFFQNQLFPFIEIKSANS